MNPIMHKKWCMLLLPIIAEKAIPSAHLYMGLKERMTEQEFRDILSTLKVAGMIEEQEETLRILPKGKTHAETVSKLIYQAVVC